MLVQIYLKDENGWVTRLDYDENLILRHPEAVIMDLKERIERMQKIQTTFHDKPNKDNDTRIVDCPVIIG